MMYREKEIIEKLTEYPSKFVRGVLVDGAPDYAFYAHAPFWLHNQAICLLGEMVVLDSGSLSEMLSLQPLELLLNAGCRDVEVQALGRMDFRQFVIRQLAIPVEKFQLLKNIDKMLRKTCVSRDLQIHTLDQNGLKVEGYNPEDILRLVETMGLPVSQSLFVAMDTRGSINKFKLPEYFPDQINVSGRFDALRIIQNAKAPTSPACFPSSSGESGFLSVPLCRVAASDKAKLRIDSLHEAANEQEIELTQKTQKLYEHVKSVRVRVINLVLQKKFDKKRGKYNHLVVDLGDCDKESFAIYQTRVPSHLIVSHRCRVVGKVLRYFDPKIAIKDMMKHEYMKEFGFAQDERKVALRTFREWMWAEEIKDRKSKVKISS